MAKIKPMWAKKVEKKLIDKAMTKRKLSEELNVNYTQMSAVMNGTTINENMANQICNYLGIER